MHVTLQSAADDGQLRRAGEGEVSRGNRGGRRSAQRGDLDRVNDGQRTAADRVAEHERPLDGRKSVARRITGEVAVGLGSKVQSPTNGKDTGLDVKSPLTDVHRRDSR